VYALKKIAQESV